MRQNFYGQDIKVPRTVFHYTGIDSMIGILDHCSGVSLMCTDCRFLNDADEYMLGRDLALEWLSQYEDADVILKVEKVLARQCEMDVFPWIMSFSIEPDSVPHWMNYSRNGGVALGLSFSRLERAIKKLDDDLKTGYMQNEESYIGSVSLLPCIYYNERNGSGKDAFLSRLEYIFMNRESFYPLRETNPERYAMFCARHIMRLAAGLKRNEFRFEQEWRIVLSLSRTVLQDRFRIVGSKPRIDLRPYVPHNVVEQVVVSPHGSRSQVRVLLEMIKVHHDNYSYSIINSTSSYRGH